MDSETSSTSSAQGDLLDLERDLPTTAEDVAMLRRLRDRRLTPAEYQALLDAFGDAPTEVLRKRRGPRGEPFTL